MWISCKHADRTKGYAVIQKTFPSMPAQAADLHTGGVVLTVNGKSTLDMAPAEVWDWFTGMPGTPVHLEVSRDNQPFEVTLRRMDIGTSPTYHPRHLSHHLSTQRQKPPNRKLHELLTFFLRRYMYRTEEEGYAGPNRYVED